MILIDKMKDLKIYRTKTFLPTLSSDKKKNSAILLMTPNFESSKKLMNHQMFVNNRRFMSYYLERDVSYYIGKSNVKEVSESTMTDSFTEGFHYLEEVKRSELPDSAFGVPSKRKFPLDTEKHVRSAIKFFNYVDPEDEEELARRILAAMKRFGITDVKVSDKNRFSKYYHKSVSEGYFSNKFIGTYYRITYQNKGIYDAYKEAVDKQTFAQFLNSSDAKWLPKPKVHGEYKSSYESYFTEIGYEKFLKTVYPRIIPVFGKSNIKIEEFEDIPYKYELVYDDKYQVVIDKDKPTECEVIESVNESMENQNNSDVERVWFVKSSNGVLNACVKIKGYKKPMRGRSEVLVLKDDMILLNKKNNGFCSTKKMKYGVPGGGWDPEESHLDAGVRETKEEALVNTKNVIYGSHYIEYDRIPKGWVIAHVDPKHWWYGYYTEVFIGEYNGKYKGEVAEEDQQKSMANDSKFYPIKDVYHKLHPSHKEAIKKYYEEKYDISIEDALQITEAVQANHNDKYRASQNVHLYDFKKIVLSPEIINSKRDTYGVLRHVKPEDKGFLYVKDDKFVAMVAVTKKEDNHIWLQALEVAKAYQGKGLSNELIKIAKSSFGLTHLTVRKESTVAYDLYKKCGFSTYKEDDTTYYMSTMQSNNESYIEESLSSDINFINFNDTKIYNRSDEDSFISPDTIIKIKDQLQKVFKSKLRNFLQELSKRYNVSTSILANDLYLQSYKIPVRIIERDVYDKNEKFYYIQLPIYSKSIFKKDKYLNDISVYFDFLFSLNGDKLKVDNRSDFHFDEEDLELVEEQFKELNVENIDTIVFDIGDVLLKTDGPDAQLMDYTLALLDSLREKGYSLYYLSNWNKTNYEYNKNKGVFEFLVRFDGGIFDWELDVSKPNLRIYEALIGKYNLTPSKCIFYDDKYENIAAAERLGFNARIFDKTRGLMNVMLLPDRMQDVRVYESYLINEKDIYYNKDKFDSGEINLCFITGHSGSGKSTMGLNATKGKEDKVDTYCLDDLQWSWKFSDDNLKEYGDLIYSFFKGSGKKYRIPYRIKKNGKLCGLTGDDVNQWYKDNGFESLTKYVDQATNAFVDYSIKYANSHKNKKYIIEGIQLFLFIEPKKLENYAVYIKGTSALISTIRGVKRDSLGPTHIVDNMSMFFARMKDALGVNGFESRINKYRKFFKGKVIEESYIEDYDEEVIPSSILDILPESAMEIDDKVVFFNEDANSNQLRKLLYSSRIRNRMELLNVLDRVKKDVPWLQYIYPDPKRFAKKNLYIDLYYYNALFLENNYWNMNRGVKLYTEFMKRLINNSAVQGYTKKTVFIPIGDWDFNHDGNAWNYKISINPISCIYQMLFTSQMNNLKKIFSNMDVIFVGSNKYFKMNFSSIDVKEIKKIALKFRVFIRKICKNEDFDLSDIDTTVEDKDSSEVIANKIIDKVENSKGVDITKQVDDAIKNLKAEKKARGTHDVSVVDAFNKEKTTTKQDLETKLKVKELEAKRKEEIQNSPKSMLAKAEEEQDIDQIDDPNEENIKKFADAIAKASEESDSEEDAMERLDDDEELKRIAMSISSDDNKVVISASRTKRMKVLNNKLMDTQIHGRSIKDILEDDSSSKEEVSKFTIASPNDEWDELRFINFDKNYNIDADIVNIFMHFANCSRPVSIRNLQVEDSSTSEDRTMLYNVDMEDYRGVRFNIKLDIPIMEDNRFLLRGNYKSIQTQFFNMPIIKTDNDTCQLISNYNKIFLYRFGSTAGKSSPIIGRIIKSVNKYKGKKIKFVSGYNLKVSNKYDLPIDYIDLSTVYTEIDTPRYKILLDQDKIRKDYVIESGKGIPYAYDKQENAILYFDPIVRPFDNILIDVLGEADPKFLEIFDSVTRPKSGAFTRASIMSSKIPLVIICGYYVGLRETLSKADVEYEIVDKLTPEIRRNYNKDWIRFEDGYVVYTTNYNSNLLLNGLKECSTTMFKIADIDNKNMYLEFLDNYGGRIKADGLDNFRDLFIDPMIKQSLEYYKMPTDFIDVMLYGSAMLGDNSYIKHTNTASRRLRRYQIISAYTYKVLSESYASYSTQLKHSRQLATMDVKRSAVIDMFLTDNITSDDSCINALRDIETTNAITTKGPSGMNSDRAYSIDKRAYDDSMINVLGMSTGFAGNVGITRQTTIDASVSPDGYVKPNNGNTENMNDANTLTATEALTPFGSTHDDPMRTAMTFIQTSKHSVRTEESDPLLVTNGVDEIIPYMTTNKFAYKAEDDGKIIDITDTYILVEYKNGKRDIINLSETIEKNSDGGYFVPLKLDKVNGLRKNMTIKKNQILAYDKYSFSSDIGESDSLAYNIGKLAKVAVINTDEGFEDSGIISSSMAKKLATRIDIKYECIIDKDATIFKTMKVGDHVEASDNLIIWEDAFDDEETNATISALQGNLVDISDIGKRKLKSEVTGTLKGIKIYRTVELDDMSPSVRKFVNSYEKPIREMAKIAEENGISKSKVPASYKLPPTGKLKKSQDAIYVEFYVEYLDTVGVGDKVVYMSANKAIEKNIFPEGKEPYTAYRPNEIIDAMVSVTSINHRIVTSSLIIGALNKLMIELDRHVKDIMEIPYDDSTI